MFCTKCGSELREKDKFCAECATPTHRASVNTAPRVDRLCRSVYDRKIAGVCAGIARYMQVDVTAIRILAVVLLFWPVPFVAAIAYMVAWVVMPAESLVLPESTPRTHAV